MSAKSQAEKLLNENPDVMHDIMKRVREDPQYCVDLYKDCPGMQEALNKNPDLRRLFEDPELVRRSFESVYVENGGDPLPPPDPDPDPAEKREGRGDLESGDGDEDMSLESVMGDDEDQEDKEDKEPMTFVKAIKAVLKAQKQLKKLKEMGNPMSYVQKFKDMIPSFGGMNPPEVPSIDLNALEETASTFENPDVAEGMDQILDNPENLKDAIENNDGLRELRDGNPMAAGMMEDPETLKVITDPSNIRGVGDINEAMENDFLNSMAEGGGGGDAFEGLDGIPDGGGGDALDGIMDEGGGAFDGVDADLEIEGMGEGMDVEMEPDMNADFDGMDEGGNEYEYEAEEDEGPKKVKNPKGKEKDKKKEKEKEEPGPPKTKMQRGFGFIKGVSSNYMGGMVAGEVEGMGGVGGLVGLVGGGGDGDSLDLGGFEVPEGIPDLPFQSMPELPDDIEMPEVPGFDVMGDLLDVDIPDIDVPTGVAIGAGIAAVGAVGVGATILLTNRNADENDGEASLDSQGNPKPNKGGFMGNLKSGLAFVKDEAGGFLKEVGVNELLGEDMAGAVLDQADADDELVEKDAERKAALERGEIFEEDGEDKEAAVTEDSKPKEKGGFFSVMKKGRDMVVKGAVDAATGALEENGLVAVTEKLMGKKEDYDEALEEGVEEEEEEEDDGGKKQSKNDTDERREEEREAGSYGHDGDLLSLPSLVSPHPPPSQPL